MHLINYCNKILIEDKPPRSSWISRELVAKEKSIPSLSAMAMDCYFQKQGARLKLAHVGSKDKEFL